MQIHHQYALAIAVVLQNGYRFGANRVERFVNYRTWHLIPADVFQAYHRAQQPLIQGFVVAPMAIGIVLQLWLGLRVPRGVDFIVPLAMVVASAAGAASTALLQLPIHAAFNRSGYSPELMQRLLRTDWIRKAAGAVRLAATVQLLHQLLSAH